MSHATKRLAKRYPDAQVSPKILLDVIRAGNATESFKLIGETGIEKGRRHFKVPIGTLTIFCLVSQNLDFVISVLPPETQLEAMTRKKGEENRRIHKELKHGPQGDAEAITPAAQIDDEARAKVEQESSSAAIKLGNLGSLAELQKRKQKEWYDEAKKRLDAYVEL